MRASPIYGKRIAQILHIFSSPIFRLKTTFRKLVLLPSSGKSMTLQGPLHGDNSLPRAITAVQLGRMGLCMYVYILSREGHTLYLTAEAEPGSKTRLKKGER